MGIFEKFYEAKRGALNESVTNEALGSMDESAVLIEYIQDLEEKLAVYVKTTNPVDGPHKARTPDSDKHTPEGSASRKAAADKIRASRKATGAKGSDLHDADKNNITVQGANKR